MATNDGELSSFIIDKELAENEVKLLDKIYEEVIYLLLIHENYHTNRIQMGLKCSSIKTKFFKNLGVSSPKTTSGVKAIIIEEAVSITIPDEKTIALTAPPEESKMLVIQWQEPWQFKCFCDQNVRLVK